MFYYKQKRLGSFSRFRKKESANKKVQLRKDWEKEVSYEAIEVFKPNTETVEHTFVDLSETSKTTTRKLQELNEPNVNVKCFELLFENGIVDAYLIRPLANLIKPETRSQYRVIEDPDSATRKSST